MDVKIYQKVSGDSDESYSLVHTEPNINGDTVYTNSLASLLGGTEYNYKITTVVNGLESAGIIVSGTQPSAIDSDYQAVLNRATELGYTLPSVYQQARENTLVIELKAAGIWAALDVFYSFATDGSKEFATLNWKNPLAHQCTLHGTLTFAAKEGFTGNGTSGYINTNFIPKTHGVNITVNEAGIGGYQGNNVQNNNCHLFSSYNTGPMGLGIATRNAANSTGYRVNSSGADAATVADLNSIAFWHLKRTGATANSLWKNGVLIDSGTIASSDLPSQPVTLLAVNVGGTVNAWVTSNIKMFWAGASMEGKENLFYTIWMQHLGSELNVILSSASHCWFARNIALYNATANKTWIGQVHNKDNNGYAACLIQVDHANNNAIFVMRLATAAQFDDHNEPSVLMRTSNGTLFCCYSEHSGSVIRIRRSITGYDAAGTWNSESTINPAPSDQKYTYPSCFEDAAGNIWIFFRQDAAGWSYVKSTDGGASFSGYKTFFYGGADRGYLTFAQDPNNKNLIHFVGSSGHPTNTTPVSIYHFYFNCATATLHKSDGTDVTANAPLTYSTGMTPVMTNAAPDTGWFEDIAVDSTGKPRILITHLPAGKDNDYLIKDLYYSEWTGSAWTTPYKIHTAMSRYIESPNSVSSSPGNTRAYPPNSTFDRLNPDIIYAGIDVDGVIEIFKLTRVAADNFTSVQKTFNSTYDNWRPQAINSATNNVMWLSKIFYPDYINYDQQLILESL